MDKAWTKLTRIAVTGILFLLLACGARAEEKALTAACPSRCGVAVEARLGGDGYILSLPGFWDLTKVTIEKRSCWTAGRWRQGRKRTCPGSRDGRFR